MQSNDGRQELSDLVIQEFIHSDDKKEFCESVVNDASSKKLPKTLEGSDWIYFVSGWFINPDGRYSKRQGAPDDLARALEESQIAACKKAGVDPKSMVFVPMNL